MTDKPNPIIKQTTRKNGKGYYMWCPGCNELHSCNDSWNFNGDLEKPTFSPSLLVRYQYGDKTIPEKRCHSFIRDGHWQFLSDCTHELAGQTVLIPPLPDWV